MDKNKSSHRILLRIFRLWLILAVPVLLVMGSIRLVMTPLFFSIEYHRAGFPDDFYGFTLEDRLEYAPFALNYLFNGDGIDYLGDLRLPIDKCWNAPSSATDCPMYEAGALRHMEDVKVVTQVSFFVASIVLLVTFVILVILWRIPNGRRTLRLGLLQGSLFTLAIVASIVVFAIAAWNTFFDTFHELFFEAGTWRFAYSDTLIRLFPEQFWFDASLTIGGLTTLGAIVLLLSMWQWGKRATD